MRQSTPHTPAWHAHAPAPHSKLPPRQSRVHIVPAQAGASDAATHVLGWQHCAGTQSASERQAPPVAEVDATGWACDAVGALAADDPVGTAKTSRLGGGGGCGEAQWTSATSPASRPIAPARPVSVTSSPP